jgi:hypothetical protein
MTTAGYSGTPLVKKLGIGAGFYVLTVNAPDDYAELVEPLPDDVEISDQVRPPVDLVHIFTNTREELFRTLAVSRLIIKQHGSIWVSWYKRAAKLATEITEDLIRKAAFPLGLVDIKVCAVDDKWSGLKLMIRKENRV